MVIGSQQRRPGSQQACTLPDSATARAALPYFSFTCSLTVRRRFHDCVSSHTLKRIYSRLDISVNAYMINSWSAPENLRFRPAVCGACRPHPPAPAQPDGRPRSVRLLLCGDSRQSQPKISRHLAYLRRAGIVAARREGKWMHYRIVHSHACRRGQHSARGLVRAQAGCGDAARSCPAEQGLLCVPATDHAAWSPGARKAPRVD